MYFSPPPPPPPQQEFDVVLVIGKKDLKRLAELLFSIKNNVLGHRNIYIVLNLSDPEIFGDGQYAEHANAAAAAANQICGAGAGVFFIDESIYPFGKPDIEKYLGVTNRTGWYFQQLLKLYSGFVINGILDNYLVIDGDTIFLRPTVFFHQGKPCYNYGPHYYVEYFKHMQRLHPELAKFSRHSGICHHMMFQTKYLRELFDKVENYHRGEDFWRCFLKCVDPAMIIHSGGSEYEIYYNYMYKNHPEKIVVRELIWWENRHSYGPPSNVVYVSIHV
jgi:uncharacterized short protein YbdD (DUF466 family)